MLLKMQCPRFGIYFGFSFLPCSVPVRAKHMEWNQVGLKIDFSKCSVLFLCLLNLKVLKNGVLEGSRLDFGGPGVRFWRLQASISKGFGTDFSKMFDVFWAPLVRKCFLPAS